MPVITSTTQNRGGAHGDARLPFELSSIGVARHLLAEALDGAGVASTVVDDVVLVVSELVTNTVRHGAPRAGGTLDVSWDVQSDHVRISVHEGGPPNMLRPQPFTPEDTGRRGLFIVDHLSDRWWVDYDNGLRITADLGTVLCA